MPRRNIKTNLICDAWLPTSFWLAGHLMYFSGALVAHGKAFFHSHQYGMMANESLAHLLSALILLHDGDVGYSCSNDDATAATMIHSLCSF